MNCLTRRTTFFIGVASVLIAVGCERDDMWEQQRTSVLGPNDFYADNQGARTPVRGTVARGENSLQDDDLLYRGVENGQLAERFPFAMTKAALTNGQKNYDIFCSPCHAKSGDGLGMIVQRGFKQPFSMHIDRLRAASPGYFYSVMMKGLRPTQMPTMKLEADDDKVHPPISRKMSAEERWQVIGYIKALQLSQNARVEDVPADKRADLDKEPTAEGAKTNDGAH